MPIESQNSKYDKFIESSLTETSPNLIQMINLDGSMKNILESDYNEDTKVKLFVQALNKFLSFKNKYLTSNTNSGNENTSTELIPSTNVNPNSPNQLNQNQPLSSNSNLLTPNLNLSNTSNASTLINSTPNKNPRKSLQLNTKSGKTRAVKTKALRQIRKIFDEKSSSSEEDRTTNWKPYHAPKNIKRIQKRFDK